MASARSSGLKLKASNYYAFELDFISFEVFSLSISSSLIPFLVMRKNYSTAKERLFVSFGAAVTR